MESLGQANSYMYSPEGKGGKICYKIDSRGFPAMATGFCSGLSRISELCGAVTGAVMDQGIEQESSDR